MTTLSVVIPYMESYPEKRDLLKNTCKTFTGADEIIIVSNWREGYAKPINKGLAIAKGDFIVVMNDDLTWDGKSLKRLCDPEAVVSPMVNGRPQDYYGCAWCMPRWVYEKMGGMDEGYEISYFDDEDFWQTMKKLGIKHYCNTEVEVTTKGGATLDKMPDRNQFFEKNRLRFIEKWGYDPSK
jgi:GT2 family glycosyltransferase